MITDFEKNLLNLYIMDNLVAFKKFMGIDVMPDFNIVQMVISLTDAKKNGYGVPAAHFYDVNADKHILKVWKDIYKSVLHADYLIFHEFTHIYDTATYSSKDKSLNVANRGYMEYHAAQVDLLKLLAAETIDDVISFSLMQSVEIISGRKTVLEYIENLHAATIELLARPDFPNSIESLLTGVGMVFNHLGRISICNMYATDYDQHKDEIENMTVEELYLGESFLDIKSIMNGFLSKRGILKIGGIYLTTIVKLAKEMNGMQ